MKNQVLWLAKRARKRVKPLRKRAQSVRERLRLMVSRVARQRLMDISLLLPFAAPDSRMGNKQHVDFTIRAATELPGLLVLAATAMGYPPANRSTATRFASQFDGSAAAADHLSELFRRSGSDKSTTHDYHLVYAAVLDPLKTKAVLEVGLGTNNVQVPSNMGRFGRPGASLRSFRDFLPSARIYGADIDRDILIEEDRIKSFHVDATDSESLRDLFREVGEELDLIIDDCLHSPLSNLRVFSESLQHLRVNGWLIIEDIGVEKESVWELVASLVPRDKFQPWLIQTRACMMFAVQRTK